MDSFYVQCLTAFHLKYEHTVNNTPILPSPTDVTLRERLIKEESEELLEAIRNEDMVKIADGIADLLYVTFGTAITYGIPIDNIFGEVHASNMTKMNKKDGYGKTIKGDNFREPQIAEVLERAHHGG